MLRNAPVCLAVHFLLVLARLSSRQGVLPPICCYRWVLLQFSIAVGGLHILSRALITVRLSRFSQLFLAALPSAHSSIKLLPFLYYSGFIIFSPSSNNVVLLYHLAYPQLPDLFLSLVLSSIPGLSHPQWREVQQVWLLLRSSGCSPSVHARVCADLLVGMVGIFTVSVWGCISMCLAES